jgi:hypothetical protein
VLASMHLIQILLPVCDNEGHEYPPEVFETIARGLTERFGGLTSFMRSPAEGRWSQGGKTDYDEIIVIEVMTADLDRDWWGAFRIQLEGELRQKEIVIRAQPIERL